MDLLTQIAEDRAAVDAALAKLNTDQAAYDATQPHMSVVQEIEAEAAKLGVEAGAVFHALAGKLRGLFNREPAPAPIPAETPATPGA